MMQNLDMMTTIELKRYLSEHRNDEEKFRTALEVLMNRDNLSPQQPYPFDLENPEKSRVGTAHRPSKIEAKRL